MRSLTTAYEQSPYSLSAGFIILCLLVVMALPTEATANSLGARSSIGGRVGAFLNSGAEGQIQITNRAGVPLTTQDVQDGSIYAEFFYGYAFSQFLSLEIALGITSRTELKSTTVAPFGSVIVEPFTLYPIQLSGKLYPLGNIVSGKVRPYAQGGVTVVMGSQKYFYNSLGYDAETNLDLNLVFGGGADVMVSSKIGLNVSAKYLAVDFGENDIYNVSDFSGMSITVGAFYTGSAGAEEND